MNEFKFNLCSNVGALPAFKIELPKTVDTNDIVSFSLLKWATNNCTITYFVVSSKS